MLTISQLARATGATPKNAELFLPHIISTLEQFQINTSIRQLCFLAQTGHESGGLFYTEELASGKNYEGRKDLGNTYSGDGVRFKGRGLIQITGRANYQALSDFFHVDFIGTPSFLGGGKNGPCCNPDQLKYAALSAGWFWSTHKLNALADTMDIKTPVEGAENWKAFIRITKKINGGTNGLNDRVTRYNNGRVYFVGVES